MVPIPTKVVRSGMTGWRPAPLSATCHHAPVPACVGSVEAVTGPPTQARLPLMDRHVTGPLKVVPARLPATVAVIDQTHFMRTFRQHFGLTPQVYRRAVRQ